MIIKNGTIKKNYTLITNGVYITFNGIKEEPDGGFSLAYNEAHVAGVAPEVRDSFLYGLFKSGDDFDKGVTA